MPTIVVKHEEPESKDGPVRQVVSNNLVEEKPIAKKAEYNKKLEELKAG